MSVSGALGQVSFTLRIELEGIEPIVWRRLLVPGEFRLSTLHDVFQAAMGWQDLHLHSFTIDDTDYAMLDEDAPDDEIDEATVTVLEVLRGQTRFRYTYDFGDDWCHDIAIEDEVRTQRSLKLAVCVDGENGCPPEDCGGPEGYRALCAVLADPTNAEHERFRDSVGGSFDPRRFDVVAVNAELQRLR